MERAAHSREREAAHKDRDPALERAPRGILLLKHVRGARLGLGREARAEERVERRGGRAVGAVVEEVPTRAVRGEVRAERRAAQRAEGGVVEAADEARSAEGVPAPARGTRRVRLVRGEGRGVTT